MSSPTGTVATANSGAANAGSPTGSQNADVTGDYVPVRVNLRAEISVAGDIEIFTTADTIVDNVVVCAEPLSVSTLFNVTAGVFEFTEPSATRSDIVGTVSGPGSTLNGFAAIANTGLPAGLQACLEGELNAEDANPFNKYKGVSSGEYTTYESLGELVLSLYASHLFGHPAATAGITNDIALRDYINGAAGANAMVGVNLGNAIAALSEAEATAIVKSVLSQDPRRATNVPNRVFSAADGETHVPLIFRTGDVIYVSITVNAPTVTASGTGALSGIAVNAASRYPATAPKFAFEITLA